jgi:hypothetical protein
METLAARMSARSQTILVWWALIFMVIYAAAFIGLLKMVPPPPPTLTPDEVAAFYAKNAMSIKLGAMIASWTSAFMVPLAVVIAVQLARLEKGAPVWSIAQFAGGILMSLFLVLPPLFWGIAAFNPARPAEVTALMHETALLTLVTTDQFYIFQMVAIGYVSLTQKADPHSPFPRWMGYYTLWAALMFEVGAIAFLPKTGPFSWSGLFVFWSPFVIFFTWMTVLAVCLLRAIRLQRGGEQLGPLATSEALSETVS